MCAEERPRGEKPNDSKKPRHDNFGRYKLAVTPRISSSSSVLIPRRRPYDASDACLFFLYVYAPSEGLVGASDARRDRTPFGTNANTGGTKTSSRKTRSLRCQMAALLICTDLAHSLHHFLFFSSLPFPHQLVPREWKLRKSLAGCFSFDFGVRTAKVAMRLVRLFRRPD